MYTIENTLYEYSNIKLNQNRFLSNYLKISQKWVKIMGETLSKICVPSFYINGILTITVIDSVWANEIFLKRTNIFKNIEKETNIIVTELKTRIGEIENYIHNKEKNNINNIKNISKEHKEWVSKTLCDSKIEDDKMKELFYNVLLNLEEEINNDR